MPNYRLLLAEPIQPNQTTILSKEHSQHLCKVLRLREGEQLTVFHPLSGEYAAELITPHQKHAAIQIQQQLRPAPAKPKCRLHLAQAVSRGDRMDYAIQKATELGVHEITPILSKRCSVQLSKERWQKRMQHWQGVIDSAVQQCGRIDIPLLNTPQPLESWLAEKKDGLLLAALVNSGVSPLAQAIAPTAATVLIGPEGGFADAEITHIEKSNFKSWQIGPRVLRTETAGVVALALLQQQFGDIT